MTYVNNKPVSTAAQVKALIPADAVMLADEGAPNHYTVADFLEGFSVGLIEEGSYQTFTDKEWAEFIKED